MSLYENINKKKKSGTSKTKKKQIWKVEDGRWKIIYEGSE